MAITLRRQLNDEEKQIVLARHGRKCYATGHDIPEGDKVHFDHIKAFASGGATDLNNIAPMCEKHNLQKGQLPLEDFRIKLHIDKFFSSGKRLTLRNLLRYLKGEGLIPAFGERVSHRIEGGRITLESADFHGEFKVECCPLTNWKYFYCTLPISVLDSDDEDAASMGLQPRYLIQDKVFNMFRHFQHYPVLQPSIGRIDGGKIVLFDGQHKAAALLWTQRRTIECKIYVDPNLEILNSANIAAHDKFAQTRFFSSIMVLKLGTQFGRDFEEYKNHEDCRKKTECGFLEYLSKQPVPKPMSELRKAFRSYLYNSILEDESNLWKKFVSASNRGTKEQPITMDMLAKSIFVKFICAEPKDDDILSEAYKRDDEMRNVVRLMNIMFERALKHWNANAAQYDTAQLRLSRLFSSKSIMAWSDLFKAAVCSKLEIDDDDRREVFYRPLDDSDFAKIETIFNRLVNWQMWSLPKGAEIDDKVSMSKADLKKWFRDKGLTTGYLLGAAE